MKLQICLSKFVFSLAQGSYCSQILAFKLNGCIAGYNSQKQLATAFQNLIIEFFNCTGKGVASLIFWTW